MGLSRSKHEIGSVASAFVVMAAAVAKYYRFGWLNFELVVVEALALETILARQHAGIGSTSLDELHKGTDRGKPITMMDKSGSIITRDIQTLVAMINYIFLNLPLDVVTQTFRSALR